MKIKINDIKIGERKREPGDVSDLADSIAQLGLLQPIVVTQDMRLVAGRRRLEACKRLGWTEIDATVATLDDLTAELAEIDENLIRAELTVLERAEQLVRRKEIYEALHPEAKKGQYGHKGTQTVAKSEKETVSFSEDTATKTGLTPRTIRHDVQIASKIAPDVRDAIRSTPIADSKRDLLALARKEPEEQRQIAQMIMSNEAETVSSASKRIRIAEREAKAEQFEAKTYNNYTVNDIFAGDVAEVRLPPESVDMIFTDPPYHDEYLKLYRDLAEFADACLKPGAYLMVYCGKMYLPEVMDALGERLEYVWLYGVYQPDNNQKVQKHHIFEAWRPILCYKKLGTTAVREWQPDMIKGTRDKTFHDWQQQIEPALKWIGAYTNPGDLVVDPFVGGGTTIKACVELKRNYIGFDIDQQTVKIAKSRIADE
jgi:ParB family chromosome partitioning protein